MRKNKAYFFTGIDGITGILFRKGNKPPRPSYEHLFDSVPFILDSTDSAKELESGHIRTETDVRAINRSNPHADNFARGVLAHQLPVIKNAIGGTDALVSSSTASGIKISLVTYTDPISGRIRRDYVIEQNLSMTSADGSLIITPIANGFDIVAAAGLANDYKVKADAADPTPDFLDAKIGNGLTINGSDQIVPVFDGSVPYNITLATNVLGFYAYINKANTNTVQLVDVLGNLTANVRYNGTWFTETASGLELVPNSITSNYIANGTILGTDFNANAFGDGLILGGSYAYASVGMSVALTGASPNKVITLVNDSATPGNDMFYGTNGSGTKGWISTLGFYDSPWQLGYLTNGVNVKNTLSDNSAPYTVATGKNSNPWIPGSLANAVSNYGQSMNVMLEGTSSVMGTVNLNTVDSRLLVLPTDCVAFVTGVAIAQDVATADMAVYKFSFSAKNIAGTVTVSEVLYDTPTTPFHVIQAGSSPYATEYTADITPDFHIYGASDKIRLDGFGIGGKTIHWTCQINIQINGGATFTVPTYTP